ERGDPKALPLLAKCFKSTSEKEIRKRVDAVLGPPGWAGLTSGDKPEDALRRLHALRTLAILRWEERCGRSSLSPAEGERAGVRGPLDRALRASLLSADPVLRENAWRILAEHGWGLDGIPEALFSVFVADPNPRARFWFALGFNQSPSSARVNNWTEPLARLAASDGTNRWMRAAILSGLKPG